jgi:hypothetical protein
MSRQLLESRDPDILAADAALRRTLRKSANVKVVLTDLNAASPKPLVDPARRDQQRHSSSSTSMSLFRFTRTTLNSR